MVLEGQGFDVTGLLLSFKSYVVFHVGMLSPTHMTLGFLWLCRLSSLLGGEGLNPLALLPRWCRLPGQRSVWTVITAAGGSSLGSSGGLCLQFNVLFCASDCAEHAD